MDSAELRNGFKLGRYTVYPLRGQIQWPGGVDDIEHKIMEVLVLLASRAGEVITRRDFLETVWQRTEVGEECLTRCISLLRKTLHDSARTPAIIRTIPCVGYELICPVEPVASEPDGRSLTVEAGANSDSGQGTEATSGWRHSGAIRAAACGCLGAWFTLQMVDVVLTLSELPRAVTLQVALVAVSALPLVTLVIWMVRTSAGSTRWLSSIRPYPTALLLAGTVLWLGFGLMAAHGFSAEPIRTAASRAVVTQSQGVGATPANDHGTPPETFGGCSVSVASLL